MHFETTRRRFIALLSSMIAFPQTKAGALPKSATPTRLKSAAPDVLLFFTQPAPEWAAALPVGNGRIGAMVFGGVNQERIAPNEDILWSGGPTDWNNPDAKSHLPVVRQLLLQQKDYQGADAECRNMQVLALQTRTHPFRLPSGHKLSRVSDGEGRAQEVTPGATEETFSMSVTQGRRYHLIFEQA
jgi:hypothetical protein